MVTGRKEVILAMYQAMLLTHAKDIEPKVHGLG